MKHVLLTSLALQDLNEIERFTEERWGAQQAARYVAALLQAAEAAATGLSAARPLQLRPGTFRLRVQSHVLFFTRPSEGEVKLLRIRHVSMATDAL